ncbi:MAG: fumarate hydratase [Anaerolineaceae bacterium]|nr:fumarate hydratase [Anaerolineaceae bacterium]
MPEELGSALLNLIRLTSTDLPPDVEDALQRARRTERPGSAASTALDAMLRNTKLARQNSTPLCQDTGTPLFYVTHPAGYSTRMLRSEIEQAVAEATRQSLLRPNAVHPISGENTGDNLGGEYLPTIHFTETEDDALTINLILKGGGCENVGAQYKLPDENLQAGRDLDGVRRVVLDAVYQAQGRGCAPGVLGVAIGGDRASSYQASKQVFLRQLDDHHPAPHIAALEKDWLAEANQLGIGPMGFGGHTTLLGIKIALLHRLPASYFVTVSYMCWAYRRRRLTLRNRFALFS